MVAVGCQWARIPWPGPHWPHWPDPWPGRRPGWPGHWAGGQHRWRLLPRGRSGAMGRRLPAGRVMRVLAIGPLLLAGLLAGAGQAAAMVAATCPNGAGGQPPGPSGGADFAGVTVVTACDVWAVGLQA